MGKLDFTNDATWDDYSCKFNSLSDKLTAAGIDANELIEVISAYENLSQNQKNNTKKYRLVCERTSLT